MLMEFPCSSSIRLPNNDDDNDDCDYDDDDYDDYDYDDYDAPPSTTIIINASWSSIPISDILWYHIHLQSRPTWCWRHPLSQQQGGTFSPGTWAAWVPPSSWSDGLPGPSKNILDHNCQWLLSTMLIAIMVMGLALLPTIKTVERTLFLFCDYGGDSRYVQYCELLR